MLSNSIALACLVTAGITLLYQKLPRKVRRVILKFGLLSDLIAFVATFYLLGGTITAMIAGSLVGIFVSVFIYIGQNPDDFVILWDLKKLLKKKLEALKKLSKEYGAKYKEHKERKLAEEVT